ncbi:hypothetical protein BOTBODRAFT_35814 [Botryobasidium botryosum FD-172 SS1]|uniref:NAD-dependent epimerase/dehydratase domain-containing protein n=1 Tax=Botryobasidium botryosum (strain FD-172 SS1) TaxID=930990 RepID=A0A067M5Q7_BOTB1|nr:hypothetical protein BOTBODRAFT_35814 [Botryobasidium botryosum FD-172 SS1]
MPAVQSPAIVLVTGASGYVAAWIVKTLLSRGFHVRGTVRSSSKGEYLVKLFEEYGSRFSYVLVEDMIVDNAYDESVRGVDAVVHTASPIGVSVHDPEDLIKPAVSGTLNLLESVRRHGSSVKRVVVTSSGQTLLSPKPDNPAIYTEADWGDAAIDEVRTKGANADYIIKYRASKILAERAAWDFVERYKNNITFDLVTVLPSFVFGPLLQEVSSLENLNTSSRMVYDALKAEKSTEDSTKYTANDVDVRDVALVHVKALESDQAGGERFIASRGPFSWQVVYDALNTANPPVSGVPKGVPGAGITTRPNIYSADKAKRVFGIEFRTLQESVVDMVANLREREVEWAAGRL